MLSDGPVFQLIFSGIATGAIYALIGLGLTLVYTTTRVINVAIGDLAAIGALIAASLVGAGLGLILAFVAALAAGAALGGGMYQLTIRPAQRRGGDVLTLLIVTIAIHLVLVGSAAVIWGTGSYTLPAFTVGPPVDLLSAAVTRQSLWIVCAAALIFGALWTFFSRSALGKGLVASAVNPLGARLSGIPVVRMGFFAFTLGGVLAAAAGVLFAPQTLATYDMGLALSLAGFVGAVLGRLGSYSITVVGCLGLGVLESLAAGLLPSGYRDAVAFVLLILILMWWARRSMRDGVLLGEEAGRV